MRTTLVILVILGLMAGVWFFMPARKASYEPIFFAEGTLVKNNPGLLKDTWYLMYENPGFSGLSIPLLFDEKSTCELQGRVSPCTMPLQIGDRVRIEGTRVDDVVRVATLVFSAPAERGIPIKLYFYSVERDTNAQSVVQCSSMGLVPVERILPATTMPLTEAIKLLLRGEISEEERARGISSEFPLFGVRLEKATIQNGIAALTFTDEKFKTSGGSCRVAVLRAQIVATARQFSSVKEVQLLPQESFQP